MKKIIGLTVVLVAVIAMLGTGTWAYFNDVVSSSGNTVTAAKLILNVDATHDSTTVANVTINAGGDGIQPGATTWSAGVESSPHTWAITNEGSVDGLYAITIASVADTKNDTNVVKVAMAGHTFAASPFYTVTSPIGALVGGTTFDPDSDPGLSNVVDVAFWVDADASNTWTTNDYYFYKNGSNKLDVYTYTGSEGPQLPTGAYDTLTNYASISGMNIANLKTITAGTPANTKLAYKWVDSTDVDSEGYMLDNILQEDSVSFKIQFQLIQATQGLASITSLAVSSAGSATTVAVGSTLQFTATATYANGSTADVTTSVVWASSDAAKATIGTSTGLATGVASGSTNITASIFGVPSATFALTVP